VEEEEKDTCFIERKDKKTDNNNNMKNSETKYLSIGK